LQHGHCKHVEGLAALTKAGKLPAIPEATEPPKPGFGGALQWDLAF
jgi:hypothetical protein